MHPQDIDINTEWVKIQLMLRKKFGEIPDLQSVLFIIGLQELGMNHQVLKREQKIDLIHVGICTVLTPFGYYKKLGVDNEGWPHFKCIKKLPQDLVGEQQNVFMKKAIITYLNQ